MTDLGVISQRLRSKDSGIKDEDQTRHCRNTLTKQDDYAEEIFRWSKISQGNPL